jgi:hypothetical protein
MKSSLFLLAVGVAFLASAGCAASPEGSSGAGSEDLRASAAVTIAFSLEEPARSPRLEALRRELADSETGYEWVANESDTFAVRVEPWDPGADVPDLVQRAFTFRRQVPLRGLRKVPSSPDGLAGALDAVGRSVDGPDLATKNERELLESRLRDAAAGEGAVVFRASLTEPDMYWEGALVVVDPAHGEILFATGGYGT